MGSIACCLNDNESEPVDYPRRGHYLKEYEQKLQQYAEMDPEHLPTKAQMEVELRPIIEGAFKLHDVAGNGVLDRDESKVFFHTLVANASPFSNAKMHAMVVRNQLSALTGPNKDKNKSLSAGALTMALQIVSEQYKDNYEVRKDEYDAAAFKVLDTNNDGRIRKADVLKALLPDTDLNRRLFEALGFQNLTDRSDLNGVFLAQYSMDIQAHADQDVEHWSQIKHLQSKLRPLITHSFSLLDQDGNGILDKTESTTFFNSLLESHYTRSLEAAQLIRMLGVVETKQEQKAEKRGRDSVKGLNHLVLSPMQEKRLRKAIKEQLEGYSKNTTECHNAAFAVIDTSGDGRLQRDEVVSALLPGTELYDAFLTALGFRKLRFDEFME